MRVFIAVLVLIFSLQSWTKADDIRDFEIEGISVGDSLLDHFSEKKIKKEMKNAFYYKDNKYADIFFDIHQTYSFLQITIKPDDKTYKIYAIAGQILYENNINECYPKIKEIASSIESQLSKKTKKSFHNKKKHPYDNSGKSIYSSYDYLLDNGFIMVQCFDWDKKYTYADKLMVSFKNKIYNTFLLEEAYK